MWSYLAIFALSACGLVPQKVAYDDERLQPLLKAIEEVDRTSFGFTPLAADAELRLEGKRANYDAMLHVYGQTAGASVSEADGARIQWIGEQETHFGPERFETPDGKIQETIVITYELFEISGAPLNQVYIDYWGEDPRLSQRRNLSLEDVEPILEEWAMRKNEA